jgi:hypothetical protein
MCGQTNYYHLCGHISYGHVTICATPMSLLHHTGGTTHHYTTFCPACSIFNFPLATTQLSLATSPVSPTVIPTQYLIHQQPPPPYVPAPSINGILTPGMVPLSVPRELRHEIIRGELQLVEHFRAEDIGISSGRQRGYNIFHGWNEGYLPRQLGEKDGSIEARPHHRVRTEAVLENSETQFEESSCSDNLSPSQKHLVPDLSPAVPVQEVKSPAVATDQAVQNECGRKIKNTRDMLAMVEDDESDGVK